MRRRSILLGSATIQTSSTRGPCHALPTFISDRTDCRDDVPWRRYLTIGVSRDIDPSFTPDLYAKALQANMLALKKAFPQSTTMQYANFMPGEWLPWDDEGYLRSIYLYGEDIGVGLGAPDLMVRRKGQLNHALAMMHEQAFSVPLGIAVQDGNYIGQTNSDDVKANRKNLVPLLHAFAKDFLKVSYMFWVDQPPYFEQDVLPCFASPPKDNPSPI